MRIFFSRPRSIMLLASAACLTAPATTFAQAEISSPSGGQAVQSADAKTLRAGYERVSTADQIQATGAE